MEISGSKANKLRQLGKYELIARIAAGGMAEVFLARQLGMMNFQKVVVVKLIHPHLSREKQFVDMFLDEARISALIKHHNVVDIYDLGLEDETYFIAMEYIAGQALSRVISRGATGKRLDVYTTASIIADAATGLDAAHNLTTITGERVELVHRDVSPGNILVSYAGAVKLVDFGVSQSLTQLKTSSENTQLKGKIGYASPEQLEEAPLDHRSDLFSLGVVLWEALTLSRLFRAESPGATVRKILAGSPPKPSELRPEVPAELDRITLKALALKREDRYQSAVEMRDDLRALLREASYHGDERRVAEHMAEVFADERRGGEDLLRQVVSAEEEIRVDINVEEELSDVRDVGLREMAAPVPRPTTNHDEELDAELLVEDDDGELLLEDDDGELLVEDDDGEQAEAELASDESGAADELDAAPIPLFSPAASPGAAASPVISLRRRAGALKLAVVGAVLAAAAVLVVVLASGDEPAPAPQVAAEVAPPAPVIAATPDAGVPAYLIGVPAAASEKISGAEVDVQTARLLYLDGWRLYMEDDGSEARVQYRAALRKVPEFPPALRGLGVSYAKENRRSKARYYLGKYLQAAPSALDAETMRELLAEMVGD